ncbi:MAG TPA: DNA primase [Treponemataceae bacterium]|jgi:DNA primase|nr:DNA primase [Treponemataceae bacterium]HQC26297.1 DNA primase [Treponemataceae bacterium]
MAKISSVTIDEIDKRGDIVALVSEYTKLEQRGANWWGCCPFHNEKTPSFNIMSEKNMYHCFGCGAGGGIIKFYMEMEKLSFVEAVLALAKKNNIEVIYEGNADFIPQKDSTSDAYKELYTRVSGSFHYFLTQREEGSFAKNYLLQRGFTEQSIKNFQLGYAPRNRKWIKTFLRQKHYSDAFINDSGLVSTKYPDYSFFANRLMFPIHNKNGDVVAFSARLLEGEGPKYINSRESSIYKKREELYGFFQAKKRIRTEKKILLCEGNFDVIAFHQAGIDYAVASLGTALTEEQIDLFSRFVDTVFLFYDDDLAGQKACQKAIFMLRKKDLTVKIILPDAGKDPAETLEISGTEGLTKLVDKAIIDVDYLLSFYAKEHSIQGPEGKAKASRAFFSYVDSLHSDIQKDASLERMSQYYTLKPEVVKKEYYSRGSVEASFTKQNSPLLDAQKQKRIVLSAELRAMIAVLANNDCFKEFRSRISVEELDDPLAQDLYIALEESYREGSMSFESIMRKTANPELESLVAKYIVSGEFSVHFKQIIDDSVLLIKRNNLEKKRDSISNQIRLSDVRDREDQKQLDMLLSEKMHIDLELETLKKGKNW